MGQHKIAESANKRPNSTGDEHKAVRVLCIVCHNPSAVFYAEDKKVYRLAKKMRRITTKSAPEVMYVHESPCLAVLVQNWAGIVAEHEAKKRGILHKDEYGGVGTAAIAEPLAEGTHEA